MNCSDFFLLNQGRHLTRVEKKLKLSDEKFKRRIGTTKPVFLTMLGILETAYASCTNQAANRLT